MKTKILSILALLLTVTQGARANWTGGTYTATANETLGSITVTYNATLFINEGVTVTVKGNENRIGINIIGGNTLTIAGPGTLVVKGADGNGAYTGDYGAGFGGNGYTAISGSIIVQGATVNVTGGHGNKGPDEIGQENAYNGGNGGAAFSGAVTIHSGTINAWGGNGGAGGNHLGDLYGGEGGNGGNAFTGTLTYYGGTVNAQGGGFGTGGSNYNNNNQSDNGTEGKAFASSVNFQNTPTTLTDGSSNIAQNAVTNPKTVNISGSDVPVLPSADASGDYLISSIYDWNTFANAVSTGATFSGKTVKLANDLSGVTMKAGTSEKPFCGTFDGQGNTLSVSLSSANAIAPFGKVENGTIKDLLVTGSVQTTMSSGADHTAGLISRADGSVNIQNVRVSATVTGHTYYAGFIGHGNSATITMTDCVFDGTLTENTAGETQHAGGFIGWGESMNITMNDCLFAGTSTIGTGGSGAKNFHPVGYYHALGSSLTLALTHVYYTVAPSTQTATNDGSPITGGEQQVDGNLALSAKEYDGNYWTTFYCGAVGYKIDEGENACAYTATYASNTLTLHKLGKVIPKNNAVIIVGEDAEISMTASSDNAEYTVSNNLHGVDVRTEKSTLGTGTFYVMGSTATEGFGFHQYTADYMPARKAYLLISGSGAALARSLTMVFGGDETGITATNYTNFTNCGDAWYTMDGRRLAQKPATKGMYINNGRKIVIK